VFLFVLFSQTSEALYQLIFAGSTTLTLILLVCFWKRSWKPMCYAVLALCFVVFFVHPLLYLLNAFPFGAGFFPFIHIGGCYIFGVYYGVVDWLTVVVAALAMLAGTVRGSALASKKSKPTVSC